MLKSQFIFQAIGCILYEMIARKHLVKYLPKSEMLENIFEIFGTPEDWCVFIQSFFTF